MSQLENIKDKYARARSRYLARRPRLAYIDPNKVYTCGICGKTGLHDIETHMNTHHVVPPLGLRYLIPMPFQSANRLIREGKTFIKLLIVDMQSNESRYEGWNALNLQDKTLVEDTNEKYARWHKATQMFISSLL